VSERRVEGPALKSRSRDNLMCVSQMPFQERKVQGFLVDGGFCIRSRTPGIRNPWSTTRGFEKPRSIVRCSHSSFVTHLSGIFPPRVPPSLSMTLFRRLGGTRGPKEKNPLELGTYESHESMLQLHGLEEGIILSHVGTVLLPPICAAWVRHLLTPGFETLAS
jgi:hypothetical protein